jgi:hypothetical protein
MRPRFSYWDSFSVISDQLWDLSFK